MLLSHRICKAGKNTAHVCLAISLLFSAGCANSEGTGTVPRELTGAAIESAIEETIETAATARPADETSASTPFDLHGVLNVSGTQLVDKNGNVFQIKGVSTHGLSWYPEYVNENAFMTLRDQWGVNTVRLAMYTAEDDGYCTGDEANRKELKTLIDAAVGYAENLGMYIIIDWHILTDNNPDMYKTESIAFFEEMAAQYSGYDNVIYEICNEPNSGTTWAQIKSYALDVISVIHEKDPGAVMPLFRRIIQKFRIGPLTSFQKAVAGSFR